MTMGVLLSLLNQSLAKALIENVPETKSKSNLCTRFQRQSREFFHTLFHIFDCHYCLLQEMNW